MDNLNAKGTGLFNNGPNQDYFSYDLKNINRLSQIIRLEACKNESNIIPNSNFEGPKG